MENANLTELFKLAAGENRRLRVDIENVKTLIALDRDRGRSGRLFEGDGRALRWGPIFAARGNAAQAVGARDQNGPAARVAHEQFHDRRDTIAKAKPLGGFAVILL